MKVFVTLLVVVGVLGAQEPNPTQRALTSKDTGQPTPVFRVTVTSRTTRAINYHHRNGDTKVDLRGTELLPQAKGEAKVDSKMGSTKIEVNTEKMTAANQFGPEYLTYVLWAITPEGRAQNLGEIVLDNDKSKLQTATDLQSFGLIVTAEPYFAVTQPSDVVVMENFVRNDTTGTLQYIDAKFELLQRGSYILDRGKYVPVKIDRKGPLQLYEARNAVQMAKMAGADRYAAETMKKAEIGLQNAESYALKMRDRKALETNAREAAQMAEDARIISIRKQRDEQLANERAAAAQREGDARAAAAASDAQRRDEEARRAAAERDKASADAARAQADQARMAADQARVAAEQMKQQADTATAKAVQERQAAEAAQAAALAQQRVAQSDADLARAQAMKSENEKVEMRQRLLKQLNLILETRDSARGLIVNISDVLFDFNKAELKPGAREKLAKVSGIILAYPGLKLQVEGHTDAIGSEDYNQKLSERRASNVRDYLVAQGVQRNDVNALGLGKADPVATNDTASGRQQNRRVEMIVSGDIIGAKITSDLRP